jgi:hypothetical protein
MYVRIVLLQISASLTLCTHTHLSVFDCVQQDCCVVFFSTSDVQKDRASLDFLLHVSKAAVLAISDEFGDDADEEELESDVC